MESTGLSSDLYWHVPLPAYHVNTHNNNNIFKLTGIEMILQKF